jgi:hypothetical protein
MRAFSVLSTVLLFAATVLAITVTNPAKGDKWDASEKGQTVAWNSVTTDPSSLTIVLSNMVRLPHISA